jgi:raffinose/stachyose/melibiose transport system substrate-binding protein
MLKDREHTFEVSAPLPRRRRRARRLLGDAVAVVAVGAFLASCGGSGSSNNGGTSAGGGHKAGMPPSTVSGTVAEWNWDIPSDDPGEAAILSPLMQMLKTQFPHLKVVNTSMTLTAQNDKLPLALASSSSAPVLTQTNEGLENQGRLVKDAELMPLNPYDKIYHWFSRVGKLPLAFNSWPADKSMFGSGQVYGVPETGTVVGVFYNKKILASIGAKPPTSWDSFVTDLGLAAKAGVTPIAYAGGQPTAYQPTHVLWMLINHYVPAAQSLAFVTHKGADPSIDTPGDVQAASTLAAWTRAGYFAKGFQGLSDDDALNMFDKGKAAFFIEGNWYTSSVAGALHNDAAFWAPPVVTGGPGEGWSIPTRSSNPDVAAAIINDVLSPKLQDALLKAGDIPVVAPSTHALAAAPPMLRTAEAVWNSRVADNQLVPYMDWAYPDLLNQAMAGIAELQGGQASASSVMASLQSDYKSYWSSKH